MQRIANMPDSPEPQTEVNTRGSAVPAPPSAAQMERLAAVTAPLARILQPRLVGIEHIPADRGVLFAGNHTMFAFLDLPFMMAELWNRRRIRLRGLGDHAHYAIPVWRNLLQMCGMVRGTRDNVRALMRDDQHVLVFPGGAGEVFKQRDQKYQLLWKERLGFVRLAIEFGYPIVPFSALGADDMFDVVADRDTPLVSQVSNLMKRLVGVPLPPLVAGVGPTLLPYPERLYFRFGQPIDTSRFEGRHEDDDAARAVRDEVRVGVQDGLEVLFAERQGDPKRSIRRRLATPPVPELAENDPDAYFVTRAFEAWNSVGPEGAAAWMSTWVQLIDPPTWPGGTTWLGRDAVVGRLRQVTAELGATWAEVIDARTEDDEVHVRFALHDAAGRLTDPWSFDARVEVAGDQIVRISVVESSGAGPGALHRPGRAAEHSSI